MLVIQDARARIRAGALEVTPRVGHLHITVNDLSSLSADASDNEIGLEGLTDRSRRRYPHANQLPLQIETQIVRLKQDEPSWGAPKIREKLALLYPDVHTPAIRSC